MIKREVLMTNHITKLIEKKWKKLTEISEATNIAYPTLSGYNQGIQNLKKIMLKISKYHFNVSRRLHYGDLIATQ